MADQILGMAMQNAVWFAIWPIKLPGFVLCTVLYVISWSSVAPM